MQNKEISNKSLSQIDIDTGDLNVSVVYDEDVYSEGGVQTVLQKNNIALAELTEQTVIKDNVVAKEGELLIQQTPSPRLHLDENGELYVSDEYADLYEIDQVTGELIFKQTD